MASLEVDSLFMVMDVIEVRSVGLELKVVILGAVRS